MSDHGKQEKPRLLRCWPKISVIRCISIGILWGNLTRFSGFPDPYLAQDDEFYRIWSNTYKKQLLREDIRDLASIRKVENVELLFSLLPSKIGSPLSVASLARDIQVSFDSIRSWIEVFENFFMIFRISPWSKRIARPITKEKKKSIS